MSKEQFKEELLAGWFEGSLSGEELQKVIEWKEASAENEKALKELEKVWKHTEHLRSMQKYDARQALKKVNSKVEDKTRSRFFEIFRKAAAILILPLLLVVIYQYIQKSDEIVAEVEWNTLHTGPGMRANFKLPDGSAVILSSNTTLSYPMVFSGELREVDLLGEAYFDVEKNIEKPFIVNAGKILVEVTGTEFIVSSFASENLTEIVLVEGSVNLCQCSILEQRSVIQALTPGDKATLEEDNNKLFVEKVNVEKYIAWKNGKLMFRDDTMVEVVRRLNRWYNVDIHLRDNSLKDYVYTATFEDESLFQVLDLLKLSAPIDYHIKPRKRKNDNTFSKMEIEIVRK